MPRANKRPAFVDRRLAGTFEPGIGLVLTDELGKRLGLSSDGLDGRVQLGDALGLLSLVSG